MDREEKQKDSNHYNRMMKVVVIGTGHVGLVTAATLAKIGHEVRGLDHDPAKIEPLSRGEVPFFEPGLQELLDEVTGGGNLSFTSDPAEAIGGAELAMICVGTPSGPRGEANLRAVERAAEDIAAHATQDMIIVQKSTVPVETAEILQKKVLARDSDFQFDLVSNPEFLREGAAVGDSLEPDRILVGSSSERAHEAMRELYEPLIGDDTHYFATDVRTAELAKHACNAFLALKISYANALAQICEAADADVVKIADIMGADERIGRAFLNAGLGYGGYCFPKDVEAFKFQASKLNYDFGLLDEVMQINEGAIASAYIKITDAVWNLEDKRIALFGLSFKPDTDDVRESPALRLARKLIDGGAHVVGYDPKANEPAVAQVPELKTYEDPYLAAEGAHCVVICTDWAEFAELDLTRLKGILTHPTIVDARNVFEPSVMEEAGFTYIPTGRPRINT